MCEHDASTSLHYTRKLSARPFETIIECEMYARLFRNPNPNQTGDIIARSSISSCAPSELIPIYMRDVEPHL